MPPESTPYRFGDLLARARQSWVNEMAKRLALRGYNEYRRSDAATMRLLAGRPFAIGELGEVLGVTRQAARKVVDQLEARGLARTEREVSDARQLNVVLTPAGRRYAATVTAVIAELNEEVARRLKTDQLLAVDSALRAAIFDEEVRERVERNIPPPAQ
jgi:DNA-binding MarR family transcriptional regulator